MNWWRYNFWRYSENVRFEIQKRPQAVGCHTDSAVLWAAWVHAEPWTTRKRDRLVCEPDSHTVLPQTNTWGLSKIPVAFWSDRTPCASPLRALARVGFLPHSINILQIPWWYGDMDWYGMSCARPCAPLRGPAFLIPLYHALKFLSPPKMWLKGRGFFVNPHLFIEDHSIRGRNMLKPTPLFLEPTPAQKTSSTEPLLFKPSDTRVCSCQIAVVVVSIDTIASIQSI